MALARFGRRTLGVLGLLLAVVVALAGCGLRPSPPAASDQAPAPQGRPYVLWMLSDIQPPSKQERHRFERVIEDVNGLGITIQMAVIAGDLLKGRSREEAFAWFLTTRNRSQVHHWFEIAGNHDRRSEPLFHQYFPRPKAYGVSFGNVLMLLLADDEPSSATEIGDEAFSWWQDMVFGHQDQILMTVSHGQLAGSGLLGSSLASRTIVDSPRFEKVLTQASVSVWASGHSHLPHALPGTVHVNTALGGTCFLNVSAIDAGIFGDSESRFLFFREGSDRLLIRSRNHDLGRFVDEHQVEVVLPRPFRYPQEGPTVLAGP